MLALNCITALAYSAPELLQVAPKLHALVQRAATDPVGLAAELRNASGSTIYEYAPLFGPNEPGAVAGTLPIVVAHGMGDSCFNPGMKQITEAAGTRLGVYSVCIPTGDNLISDTLNGFLLNMDKSVDVFAAKVRADPKLASGFNAFGLSQGNNLIRGYIAKYNDPPVRSFMSICGINAGVAAFPQCSPQIPVLGAACEALTEVLGALAYNPLVQDILFQANYFRDPERTASAAYQKNSQLAHWNGENPAATDMADRKANWAKTSQFVWVRGTLDTVVWPNEGEQWGQPPEDYPKSLKAVPMKETAWYVNDTFGLKAADDAGKNFFEEFAGEHIRMTMDQLNGWLDTYFK